ncbi:hypothetical protein PUF88_06170 [Lactobacillaceae bacterium L1_55_11]|nr:hypothetical protein [Lactobacillaceae bacterium L1_55_11]
MYAVKMMAIYLTNLIALLSWWMPDHKSLATVIWQGLGGHGEVSNLWLGILGLAIFTLAYGIDLWDKHRRTDNLAFERAAKVLANLIVLGFFLGLFWGCNPG